MKQSIQEAGYKFVNYVGKGLAVFEYTEDDKGTLELWQSNPNHASWGFHYNNTDWEFISQYKE